MVTGVAKIEAYRTVLPSVDFTSCFHSYSSTFSLNSTNSTILKTHFDLHYLPAITAWFRRFFHTAKIHKINSNMDAIFEIECFGA